MKTYFLPFIIFVGVSISLLAAPPEQEVEIAAGTTYNGSISTTASDIIVLEGARVKGDIQTSTGDVYVEANARVKSVTSIHGDVFLDVGVTVDKKIVMTNGSLTIKENSALNDDVINENGDIRISGSTLKKDVINRHGGIILKNNTYVKGNVEILDRGQSPNLDPIEIYLGVGVYIKGDVKADDEDDLVELSIYQAEVKGDIENIEDPDDDDEDDEDDEDDDDEDEGDECGGRPAWSESQQYQSGDEVHLDGDIYEAKKNSQGKEPTESRNRRYWKDVGDC